MSLGTELIPLVVTILALGVAAQVLADRLEIPSVLFLILAGIAVGPEGLDLVGLDSFGGPGPLASIVGLSVAIIIFEDAFRVKRQKLRRTLERDRVGRVERHPSSPEFESRRAIRTRLASCITKVVTTSDRVPFLGFE